MGLKRKTLTPAQRELRRYKQRAPLGIGETIDQQKAREEAEENRVIREVHAHIWLNRPACQLCGGARNKRGHRDQMHEDPSRAETRGLPPTERFNPRVCARLCAPCHADVTENRIRIVFEDEAQRFLGRIHAEPVQQKRDGTVE